MEIQSGAEAHQTGTYLKPHAISQKKLKVSPYKGTSTLQDSYCHGTSFLRLKGFGRFLAKKLCCAKNQN